MQRFFVAALVAAVVSGSMAEAASITPVADSFGDLSNATTTPVTFGGDGIPTSPAAISTITTPGGNTLLLGLSATPRFEGGPGVFGGQAGTYNAFTGTNVSPSSGTVGALWNFNFFAEITLEAAGDPDEVIDDLGLILLYEFDPLPGTDDSTAGIFEISTLAGLLDPGQLVGQSSQNLNFSFLASADTGITPPTGVTSFDPLVTGEYSFALRTPATGDTNLAAINVNANPVPLPLPAALLLTGLAGLAALRRFG